MIVGVGLGVEVGEGGSPEVGVGVDAGAGVAVGAGVGVGVGVAAACTVMVPSIPKCNRQKYGNVPAVLNVTAGDDAPERTAWSQTPPAWGSPRAPSVVV